MSSYETDIYPLYGEFDYNDKPMMISSDIKNVVLVSYTINTIKRFFNILKVFPFGSPNGFYPILQGRFSTGKPFNIVL